MVAKIAGFVTRAQAGLRAPRSVSRNITPEKGGVGVHHGGGPQSAAEPNSDHQRCIDTWRAWQNFHMNTHKWADIAYTGGYCNHGYAFAGRGAGVRTASNGTNESNRDFYGIVWIGGQGQVPSQAALDAADWWLEQLRESGAGLGVRPHSFWRPTACPVADLKKWSDLRHGKTDFGEAPVVVPPAPTPQPTPPSGPTVVHRIQIAVKVLVDGKWGPKTDLRVMRMRGAAYARRGWPNNRAASFNIRDVQGVVGTTVDGIWGPLSQAALVAWIKAFQTTINVKSDGWWGPKTDGKLLTLRRRHHNRF